MSEMVMAGRSLYSVVGSRYQFLVCRRPEPPLWRGFSFVLGRVGNCGAGGPGEGNSIQLDITPLIPRQMRDILRKLLVIWISGLAVFAGRLD